MSPDVDVLLVNIAREKSIIRAYIEHFFLDLFVALLALKIVIFSLSLRRPNIYLSHFKCKNYGGFQAAEAAQTNL